MVKRRSGRKKRIVKIWELCNREPRTFEELLNETKCSRATLSSDLKLMLNRGDLTWREDVIDRRIKHYTAVSSEEMLRDVRRYNAIDFILNLKEPVHDYDEDQIEGCKFSIAYFAEIGLPEEYEDLRKEITLGIEERLKSVLEGWIKGDGRIWATVANQMFNVASVDSIKISVVQSVSVKEKE